MNVTRGIAAIKFNRNVVNPIYLSKYMRTEESQNYIGEYTRGATLQQIKLADLRVQRSLVSPRNCKLSLQPLLISRQIEKVYPKIVQENTNAF